MSGLRPASLPSPALTLKFALALAVLCFVSSTVPLIAQVHYHDSGSPWNQKARRGPDKESGGWYYNMGITGVRTILIKDRPQQLLVKYVIPGSPAAGKIQVGDILTGANGKPFVTKHKNGYGVDVFGGDGPMKEFATALEASQSPGQGRLALTVERQDKSQQVVLEVGVKYGTYAKTYPTQCAKSNRILADLLPFIAAQQGKDGSWGFPQQNTFAPLALMASGDPKYREQILANAKFHARTTRATDHGSLINWRYMSAGIVLSEYYLATKEEWVLPELQQIYDFLHGTQYVDMSQIAESAKKRNPPKDNRRANGGWGHNPGYEGYGPIGMTTGQGALVYALLHRCGIKVDRERHDRAYAFLMRGTGRNGYVWYADEVANHKGWADMGRTGASGIAFYLSPYDEAKYRQQALLHAQCIGEHPETFPDTHGSPIMGMGYTALAANTDAKSYRSLMDSNRWWFTLAQCPDGTFYYQPNRDYNPYDYQEASRISASAVVAFTFLMPQRNLHVTGRQFAK